MRQSVRRWNVGLNLENLKLSYDKISRECAYKSPQLLTQLAQQKTTMADELKVFRTWSSPFGLRIIWALQLKGLEYETIFEDLSQKSPLLLQYNPTYKKIPVLVHNGKPISESLVILEYIEETWKQNPLLPEDPYERAMARFWAKFVDDKLLESVINVLVTGGKEQEEVVPRVMENLKHIEAELKGKKFFGGATIGFTDIALGWAANLLGVIEEVTGIKFIDAEKFPQISQWIHNFCDVPVIKANWPPRDKMVTKLQTMREKCIAPK